MRIRLLSVLLSLAAAVPGWSQPAQTYHSDAGFAVELPAHWVRVPDDALDVVRRSAAGREGIIYEAGFRLTDASWPAPPVAAIARMDLPGPVTREEFAAEFSAAGSQAEMQDAVDETPAAQLDARVSVPRWDAGTGAAWVRMSLESDGTTPSFAWSAMMLAPSGRAMILLIYYGPPGADERAVQAELKSIVRSLRAD
ncbi:MAG TPA: hypothetical protein VFT45_01210 [Longimicrobium sp.]|nr:hypothetical protein [Longimicrobium sp.]